MSKIAKKVILLDNIKCEQKDNILIFNDKYEFSVHPNVTVKIDNNQIFTTVKNDEDLAICGTMNRLINNLITGLKTPFKQQIKLEGTGFKGVIENNIIIFNLGFSHQVKVPIPEDVNVKFTAPTKIELTSIYKDKLGNFASSLVKLRPHNPYSGKGVLKEGVKYTRKETKRK